MINFLKDILSQNEVEIEKEAVSENKNKPTKLQIATCALFIEAAKADDEFLDIERAKIIKVMKNLFDLTTDSVNYLMQLSEEKRDESVSLYEYTDIINHNFNKNEKFQVMKYLWRLVLIDQNLDAYEAQFMRKIAGNLKMEHSDMIAAKMEVKAELGKRDVP
jgi:uncharacterized tellurite resistance protein B-like protein